MKHELPSLPYAYNALEPYISEDIMRLHHDKHQAAYVAGLNKAEYELQKARDEGDYAAISYWERQLAFNGSGDLLHTLFFRDMASSAGGEPSGDLADQIKKDFGSFDAFKKQFSAAAAGVEGSGWVALVWQPEFDKLYITQILNHQNGALSGSQPIMVLDVWEHAYYLQYQNRRAEWIESWWNVVNWPSVAKNLSSARSYVPERVSASM
ncbi:MAG: superoxide dismutase [Armatimonadota bacterium]|nr:superoxide dismutase [bacterium]